MHTFCESSSFIYNGFKDEAFAQVTCSLELRRKPMLWVMNMILPIILVSFLMLLVFLLPPESGEKMGFCLSLLLAYSVFLLVIGQDQPQTSENIPYICRSIL